MLYIQALLLLGNKEIGFSAKVSSTVESGYSAISKQKELYFLATMEMVVYLVFFTVTYWIKVTLLYPSSSEYILRTKVS